MQTTDTNKSHTHENHNHAHSHDHSTPKNFNFAFVVGIGLNLGFVAVEGVYGYTSSSLALMSDAGHNLSDVLSLVVAWGAAYLARRKPSQRFSYGLKSSSILASLANAICLLLVTGAIAWEAIDRFQRPAPTQGGVVMWVAGVGILINGVTALLFASGRKGDLNIRGAFQHMLADAVVSLGVVIAGLIIIYTGWVWLDPAVSLIISVVIVIGTWSLLRDSLNLALNAVPTDIDRESVQRFLAGLPGVTQVHDLHIWGMSTTETALTAHLVIPDALPNDEFIFRASSDLQTKFHIHHSTIQVEKGDGEVPCRLLPDDVV